jgi:hypothetical protein
VLPANSTLQQNVMMMSVSGLLIQSELAILHTGTNCSFGNAPRWELIRFVIRSQRAGLRISLAHFRVQKTQSVTVPSIAANTLR